jgi:O-antigen ligase
VPFLPSTFTDRMNTIQTYQADESASTRIAVWQWTIDYVNRHPFGGGFEAYRGNRIRYDLKSANGQGTAAVTADQARAYHSAYFEMLGEQGYPGLALWLFLNVAGLWRMEVLRRRYRDPDGDLAWAGPLAAALQSGHLVYLLGAAFIAIAFQPFVYMLIGAQIGLDSYCARKRQEAAPPPAFGRKLARA